MRTYFLFWKNRAANENHLWWIQTSCTPTPSFDALSKFTLANQELGWFDWDYFGSTLKKHVTYSSPISHYWHTWTLHSFIITNRFPSRIFPSFVCVRKIQLQWANRESDVILVRIFWFYNNKSVPLDIPPVFSVLKDPYEKRMSHW